uniref:Metalloendopeptidase n=1 Tax=Rhabditophanes sp. KR3021 TaxID=114890 RepID=A0AC35U840_9BILA
MLIKSISIIILCHLLVLVTGNERRSRAATSQPERLWPLGIIPYQIDPVFTGLHRRLFQMAMRLWMNDTCVSFVPFVEGQRSNQDYILFTIDDCGCCSYVGRKGDGRQIVSIGRKCDKFGIVLHELGHTIGYWHEHTREDRDSFVDIFYSSIKKAQEYNFDKSKPGEINSLGETYDYSSIMHYAKNTFSKSVYLDTILPKKQESNEHPEIGQRRFLSPGDISQTNKLYNCGNCSKTFYARKDSIVVTKNNGECNFRIFGALGERIKIKMNSKLILSNSESLSSKILFAIKDGYNNKIKYIAMSKGEDNVNSEYISKSNYLFLTFSHNFLNNFPIDIAEYEIMCGGTIKASNGYIESPNFPNLYPNNVTCLWTIEVPKTKLVAIKFHYLDIETSTNCMYDKLQFFEPNTTTSIKDICGNGHMDSLVTSVSNKIHITFTTDSTNNKNGFILEYLEEENECLGDVCEHGCVNELGGYFCECRIGFSLGKDKRSCVNVCGGSLSNQAGMFVSPNYPNQYPSNADCTWDIFSNSGNQIYLNFSLISLEGVKTDCSYDYILIQELNHQMEVNHSSTIQLCGHHDKPVIIKSTQNRLKIQFQSDSSVEKFGFVGSYQIVKDECQIKNGGCEHICESDINDNYKCSCVDGFTLSEDGLSCSQDLCSFQLYNTKGSFASPNYPNGYPNDKVCKWNFNTTPGHRLILTFYDFDLEEHPDCKYDNVSLYNGPQIDEANFIGIYCYRNYSDHFTITSTENQLFLMMATDSSVIYSGFKAFYYSVCGGNLIVNESPSFIYSHDKFGELNYNKKLLCKWRLQMDPNYLETGYGIQIKFTKFNLESDEKCSFDYLSIFDYNEISADASIIGRYCGHDLPSPIFISKQYATLIFQSDDSMEGKGFILQYRLIRKIA